MNYKTKFRRIIDRSRAITVASVAMVLLILGITLILGLATHGARQASSGPTSDSSLSSILPTASRPSTH